MIIVDKVLQFILSNDYYDNDTLKIINDIYSNLEKYNLARELTLKLEKFLIKNDFIKCEDLLRRKIEKDKKIEIEEILKIIINESIKVELVLIENILATYSGERVIFKYSLGILCRDSQKYLATAIKYTVKDPDVALFALSVADTKEAIPVIIKNISKTENDTFRECIKAIIKLKQETQLLRIIKSDLDIQKKIFILNIIQGMNLDNIKDSMIKLVNENIQTQPVLAINAMKNIKRINKEEDINLVINSFELLPPIYKNIIYDVLCQFEWEENRIEVFLTNLFNRNMVKKACIFLKSLNNDEIKNAVVKVIRIENSLEEIDYIKRFIESNFTKYGADILYLKLFTRLTDKDIKFLAVQIILDSGHSQKMNTFELHDEMLSIIVRVLTNRRYSKASKEISFGLVDAKTPYFQPSVKYFKDLKLNTHAEEIIKTMVANNNYLKEYIEIIGHTKMDNGLEIIHSITGVSNEEDIIVACIYAYRFYPPGEAYEYVKEYLFAENKKLLSIAIDTLVHLSSDHVKKYLPDYIEDENFEVKISALKGVVKFNLPLKDRLVDLLSEFTDSELSIFFRRVNGIFSNTLLEVIIYLFTQREFSPETAKLCFDYIATYPNKKIIIERLNNVLKAI